MELTLVCCCSVIPSLVVLMAFVVNVEEYQLNPAVEHIDEKGLPPAIRPQFGVPTAAPQSEAHLDDSSCRLVGIVADGLCLQVKT